SGDLAFEFVGIAGKENLRTRKFAVWIRFRRRQRDGPEAIRMTLFIALDHDARAAGRGFLGLRFMQVGTNLRTLGGNANLAILEALFEDVRDIAARLLGAPQPV